MDKYDKAIELLKQAEDFGKAVSSAWFAARADHPTGCLFQFCCPPEEHGDNPQGYAVGCLTMIKNSSCYHAWTEELTQRIRNDPRLPSDRHEITLDQLPVFAEWQREMDATIRQTPR